MNTQQARFNMVQQQIRPWDVTDDTVLTLMQRLPRELFVPKEYAALAYADISIPLPHQHTMLPPKVIARLLQALAIQPTDRVLEIGTGSGYLSALLGKLAKQVFSVDLHSDLSEAAHERIRSLGIHNVLFETGDALNGWSSHAPYDVIVLTGSLPTLPDRLLEQLTLHGRLAGFVGDAPAMKAVVVTRLEQHPWTTQELFETLVPRLEHATEPSHFVF